MNNAKDSKIKGISFNNRAITAIFDFKKIHKINVSVITMLIMLNLIGLTALYSADYTHKSFFIRQLLFLPIGSIIIILLTSLSQRLIRYYSSHFYAVSMTFLVITVFLGKISMGAKRWINIGFFQLQPSEFVKIGLVLFMAKVLSESSMREIHSYKKIIKPIIASLVSFIIVVSQPDLGTGLIILSLSVSILFVSGVKIRNFIMCIMAVVIAAPILWGKMHDYQKTRIITFLNPDENVLSSSYNINQAKMAIGNGGFFGRGILNGYQVKYKFVPENKTDFIFTVVAEEFGFIGTIAMLLLYGSIIYYGLQVSVSCDDFFFKIISFACSMLLFIHVAINIGMNTGILPVVGIPLPFISYGRSSSMTAFILIGLIFNASVNKKS